MIPSLPSKSTSSTKHGYTNFSPPSYIFPRKAAKSWSPTAITASPIKPQKPSSTPSAPSSTKPAPHPPQVPADLAAQFTRLILDGIGT